MPKTFTYETLQGSKKTITMLGKSIGKGASGEVFKCMLDGYGLVACKIFKKIIIKDIQNELKISALFPDEEDCVLTVKKVLVHKAQLKYFSKYGDKVGILDTENPFKLVLIYKLLTGLELTEVVDIKESEDSKIENDVLKQYMNELLRGLQLLQSKKVVHRDIKPHNIMLSDGKLIYIDFGMACKLENCVWKSMGTPNYMSPQVYLDIAPENENEWYAVDVYSLGMTLFYMMRGEAMVALAYNLTYGSYPEESLDILKFYRENDNIMQIFEKTMYYNIEEIEPFNTLLRGMIEPDVKRRFTVEKCLEVLNS